MNKNQDQNTGNFFSSLADTLSISSLFNANAKRSRKLAETSKAKAKIDMSIDDFFQLLARSAGRQPRCCLIRVGGLRSENC